MITRSMGFCWGLIVFAHTKVFSVTLGGIMLIWSLLALGPEDSLFVRYLDANDAKLEWAFILFSNGMLLLAGSLLPWRSGRHIGLALGALTMTAFGCYFFLEGLVTPVTVVMPFLGVMSLITMLAEAKGKPRDGRA